MVPEWQKSEEEGRVRDTAKTSTSSNWKAGNIPGGWDFGNLEL